MMNNNLKDKNAAFVNLKNNELVNAYVKDIMKYKPLSAKEESELFAKVELGREASKILEEMGDNAGSDVNELKKIIKEGDVARDEILVRNQRFVYATAKRYAQDDDMLPDLLSEGNLGLMTAFDTYEPNSGNRFCTYAVWYIRRSINAYITTGNMMINKSNNTKTNSKIGKIQNRFFAENGRYPTNSEIMDIFSEEYGINLKNEADLYDLRIDSINTGYDDEDSRAFENSAEFVAHTSISADEVENTDVDFNTTAVTYLMQYLDERESTIISMSFGLGDDNKDYSNAEIAEKFGMTAERIRQIKNAAIQKMRNHAEEVNAF